MWQNLQFPVDLSHLKKKSLMENFIFFVQRYVENHAWMERRNHNFIILPEVVFQSYSMIFKIYKSYINHCRKNEVFFSKCDQIRKLQIWSHLLKKSLMENFIVCAVIVQGLVKKTIVSCLIIFNTIIELTALKSDLFYGS